MADTDDPAQWLTPTRGALTLPAIEILTGRGFITGKSGSGKSNTASVIIEELLDNSYDLLIVDPEGEYYGLQDEYDILHVGADSELADAEIGPEDAEHIANIALTEDKPVILDVSDFLDGDLAKEVIHNVVRELFTQEKTARKPFLLVIEEMQEYLPQSGGSGELAELLTRVAKRGRKRGLGMLGLSQRPASVDKDFITQCDWLVWHRLTWQNDLDVVRKILGSDVADQVEELETGEAFLMTDWDESTERVKFREKRTLDAGATPGLDRYSQDASTDSLQDIVSSTNSDGSPEGDGPETDSIDPSPPSPAPASTEPVSVDESSTASDIDMDEASDDELRDRVRELQDRNERLESEVTELRNILADAQQSETAYAGERDPVDFSEKSAPSTAGTTRPSPDRPTPPKRPRDRSGVSGTIIEFTAMIFYVFTVMLYRIRLFFYRLRVSEDTDS